MNLDQEELNEALVALRTALERLQRVQELGTKDLEGLAFEIDHESSRLVAALEEESLRQKAA